MCGWYWTWPKYMQAPEAHAYSISYHNPVVVRSSVSLTDWSNTLQLTNSPTYHTYLHWLVLGVITVAFYRLYKLSGRVPKWLQASTTWAIHNLLTCTSYYWRPVVISWDRPQQHLIMFMDELFKCQKKREPGSRLECLLYKAFVEDKIFVWN